MSSTIACLSFLIGTTLSSYQYDFQWLPTLFDSPSTFKSAVPFSTRQQAVQFYKSQKELPMYFFIVIYYCIASSLFALLKGSVKKSKYQGVHLVGLVLSSLGIGYNFYFDYFKGALLLGVRLGPIQEAAILRDLAFGHAALIVGCGLALFLQIMVTNETLKLKEE